MKDWPEFENILCIRPDNIGDVLMTTPAIRALKGNRAGRRITLLTSTAGERIGRYIPEVDECMTFDPPWYRHADQADAGQSARLIETLRSREFEAAVIFNVYSQSPLPTAMLCHLAGINRVAAYCRENPYSLVSDWLPDEEPLYSIEHEVRRQLKLARWIEPAFGMDERLSIKVPQSAQKRVRNILRHHGMADGRAWLVLHPGASEQRRRYPAHLFNKTARLLHERFGMRIVITGSAAERALAEEVCGELNGEAVSLAGQLGVDELCALIQEAPLLVANNTGPVHIAAAVGTPVVVLYALTNPQHTPWCVPHKVLPFDVAPGRHSRNVMVRYAREHAFPEPVGLVTPDQILDACEDLLNHGKGLPDMELPGIVRTAGRQDQWSLSGRMHGVYSAGAWRQ